MHSKTHTQSTLGRRAFLGAAGAGALAMLASRIGGIPFASRAAAQAQPGAAPAGEGASPMPPNIIIVLADDMGWGDVSSYNPEHGKIPTPHIDALAARGMRFTDAHTTSPVCSPSRYGLLTGRYHWRQGIRAALPKWAGPAIPEQRLTLPQMLRNQGYHTACIGKWHLGWNWPRTDEKLDFTKPITGGPTERGFDYYFGVDVPNYPPFTFIENQHVTVQPTEHQEIIKEIIVNHEGPRAPGWKFDAILPTLVSKSVEYVEQRAKAGQPFFLYFSLTSPHYPIAPSEAFRGKSGINPLADFIMETDAALGAVADAVDRAGIADNTLILFLTDNGHDPVPGLEPFEQAGHRVSGPYRGHKFTIAEGGHRVPFVVRWPSVVPAGSVCDQTISTTDLMATAAQITGFKLPDSAGEDSTSILPLLRGDDRGFERPGVIAHAPNHAFAIRSGPWKLIFLPAEKDQPERIRLYNLAEDPDETNDRAPAEPQRVAEMTAQLQRYIRDGRSTPGAPQQNDAEVKVPGLAAGG